MIRAFAIERGGLGPARDLRTAAWIDLVAPSDAERAEVGGLVGVQIPSRADQEEIEHSSRLYLEDGTPVMTILLPAQSGAEATEMGPVTFIVTDERLVTLRHHQPRPFETFPERAAKASLGCDTVERLALGLIEEIVDRLADITESVGRDIDALARAVFRSNGVPGPDLQMTLREIGGRDALVMHLRESLMTLERMLGFLLPVFEGRDEGHDGGGREMHARIEGQLRDVGTIGEQATFLTHKTSLLLDATLGLINIEQNGIIKIFSVAAVIFLPPTLIASIYGMNFTAMPELAWPWGYPAALGLMLLSAVVPLLWFRHKGWF